MTNKTTLQYCPPTVGVYIISVSGVNSAGEGVKNDTQIKLPQSQCILLSNVQVNIEKENINQWILHITIQVYYIIHVIIIIVTTAINGNSFITSH